MVAECMAVSAKYEHYVYSCMPLYQASRPYMYMNISIQFRYSAPHYKSKKFIFGHFGLFLGNHTCYECVLNMKMINNMMFIMFPQQVTVTRHKMAVSGGGESQGNL